MGMADPGNGYDRFDTSGAYTAGEYFIRRRAMADIAVAVNQITVIVNDFAASVEKHVTNQTVIRGFKYTRCFWGMYPTYGIRQGRRPMGVPRNNFSSPPPVVRRTSRSLSPRARSTRRTRTTQGVITRLQWRSPGKRCARRTK